MNDEYKKLRDELAINESHKWGDPVQSTVVKTGFKAGFDAAWKLMQKREAGLVEALEFYEFSFNWMRSKLAGYPEIDPSVIDCDKGKKAREALIKIKEQG